LTSVAIVLEKGRVIFRGGPEEAVEVYTNAAASDSAVTFAVENAPRLYAGNFAAKFISLRFDRMVPIFSFGEDFRFFATVRAVENLPRMRFSMTIFTAGGTPVGSCFSKEADGIGPGEQAEIEVVLPNPRLAPGKYHCGVAVGRGDNRNGHVDFDIILDTLGFEVLPEVGEGGTVSTWVRGWGSTVFPELRQTILPSKG